MTDEQFAGAVHSLALALTMAIEHRGIPKAEIGKVITGTLAQCLAQNIGPVPAVERLRDIADLMERQIMGTNAIKH